MTNAAAPVGETGSMRDGFFVASTMFRPSLGARMQSMTVLPQLDKRRGDTGDLSAKGDRGGKQSVWEGGAGT